MIRLTMQVQAGRDEDDKSAEEEQDAGALPGRSWSKYAQIAARAGISAERRLRWSLSLWHGQWSAG